MIVKVFQGWFLLVLLIVPFLSQGQVVKDTVYFYRGQMLLGETLSVNEGRLQFDSDDAGVVKIKYYKIRTFSATQHFYRIRTNDQQLLYGRINTSEKEGFIRVENLGQSAEISIDGIIRIERYDNTFKDRMSGRLSAGYDYTRSSGIGRINFDISLRYLAQDYEINYTGNTQVTQIGGDFSRDIENSTIALAKYIGYKWFSTIQFRYQRNLELSIQRRFQETFGMGYFLVQKSRLQMYATSGITVNQELSTEGNAPGSLWEIPVILNLNLYEFQNPNLQLLTVQTVYFGLTQAGRIRSDGSIRLSWEPLRHFTIGLNFYSNFDTQPPEESARNADYGVVLSLGYHFN